MNSNGKFFERIPNSIIFLFIIIVFFLKTVVYVFIKLQSSGIVLGGGSDASYYHGYVQGYTNLAVNIWPVMLRYLNDIGLYSREGVSYFLFLLSLVFIPFITARLTGLSFKKNQKYYLYIILLCSVYPALFFYSFDIYRDVFMVSVFLLGCLSAKRALDSRNFLYSIFYFIISIAIGMLLLELRAYLGYAFLLSLFLWKITFTKRRIIFLGALYLIVLFIANYIGVFESLTEYRAGFEENSGGSTLGLDFSNPALFIPNFILSFLGQMLGLYVTNPLALVLLLVETLPFFLMLLYVMKNIKLADSFVRFLIIFFVLYASVWLVGNDNLGTAVRLRMYNYLAIYISFFYILRLKIQSVEAHRL
ncbi:hypothetical protein [Psychrobacter jeotgali]|uniref:hypothetical protein n=1 Tax=Psychrobacter jeotgali TaxID=179010 RepID=UPI001918DAC3|nr:hypothetical protein [Psychrobacter jeotgali]